VVVFPTNDAGSEDVRRTIERYHRPFIRIERNLSRRLYLGLMNCAQVMVGNSSSALIEAPVFKLPAVNIGTRQRDRARGNNVIDVSCDQTQLRAARPGAFAADVRAGNTGGASGGDGQAAKRITEILATVPLDDTLLKKQLSY
jgi:UDP-N-acetylglucosamine 2-epimerase